MLPSGRARRDRASSTLSTRRTSERRRAGAHVEAETHVYWPADTLREFLLFDGLMHEIGHHIVQHATGKRTARVLRTADHERRADAFAAACREKWPR